ncbi:MAG: homoserine kinase [Anaerolineae bacterium]
MKIIVHVPATTANLGPGFDCLGLALQIWNTITLEESAAGEQVVWRDCPPSRRVDPSPFDAACLPPPGQNLILKAMHIAWAAARVRPPALRVSITNCIPISRGLGSSAAAIVGGLVAANAWGGNKLSSDRLLELATEMEGHPDNASAALFGGLTISATDGPRVTTQRLVPPRAWRAVLFVPAYELVTRRARAVLPRRIPRADAIFNIGRAALLVHAFGTGDPDALNLAMQDALHQPYRARLVPGMFELFEAAQKAGACGVALSGAGPALIAFAQDAIQAEGVRAAFAKRARALGIAGAAHMTGLSARGAYVRKG